MSSPSTVDWRWYMTLELFTIEVTKVGIPRFSRLLWPLRPSRNTMVGERHSLPPLEFFVSYDPLVIRYFSLLSMILESLKLTVFQPSPLWFAF